MRKWIAAALLSLVTVAQGVTYLEDVIVKDNTGTTNSLLGITLKGVRITQWPFLTDTPTNGLIYYDTNSSPQSVLFNGLTNVVLFYDGTTLAFTASTNVGGSSPDIFWNHTGTQNINMAGFSITNVSELQVSNNTITIGDVVVTASDATNLFVGTNRTVLLPELGDFNTLGLLITNGFNNTTNYIDAQDVAISNYATSISNSLVAHGNTISNNLITYVDANSNSLVTHANTISNNLIDTLTHRFTANGSNIVSVGGSHVVDAGSFNAVLSGTNNAISDIAGGTDDDDGNVISGGEGNTISNIEYAVISGGLNNRIIDDTTANRDAPVIGGGQGNTITASDHATISGGINNDILSNSRYATVGGGNGNDLSGGDASTVSGGQNNDVFVSRTTIGGGNGNSIKLSQYGSMLGGRNNEISERDIIVWTSTGDNDIENPSVAPWHAILGGGYLNDLDGESAVLVGGEFNINISDYASLLGGFKNMLVQNSDHSVILGGNKTVISSNAPNSLAYGSPAFIRAGDSNSVVLGSPGLVAVRTGKVDDSSEAPNRYIADSVGGMTPSEYQGMLLTYEAGNGYGTGIIADNTATSITWLANQSVRRTGSAASYTYKIWDRTTTTSGTNQFLFGNQNVGIGVTNGPQAKLHVRGKVKIDDVLNLTPGTVSPPVDAGVLGDIRLVDNSGTMELWAYDGSAWDQL